MSDTDFGTAQHALEVDDFPLVERTRGGPSSRAAESSSAASSASSPAAPATTPATAPAAAKAAGLLLAANDGVADLQELAGDDVGRVSRVEVDDHSAHGRPDGLEQAGEDLGAFAELDTLLRVEKLAASAADGVLGLAEYAVAQEDVEGHDGGRGQVGQVGGALVAAERVEDVQVQHLGERQLDVKLSSGTRVGVGRERDAEHFAGGVDRQAAEREGVLAAVERGLAERGAESVRVRGDEGVPDVDAGLAVRSTRGGRLGPGRANLSDLAVIVRDRRVALELEAEQVGMELDRATRLAAGVGALGEGCVDVARSRVSLLRYACGAQTSRRRGGCVHDRGGRRRGGH